MTPETGRLNTRKADTDKENGKHKAGTETKLIECSVRDSRAAPPAYIIMQILRVWYAILFMCFLHPSPNVLSQNDVVNWSSASGERRCVQINGLGVDDL